MRRDKDNSKFDFENDKKFDENFKKNIEKALDNSDNAVETPEVDMRAKEKTENISEATPKEENTADKATDKVDENAADKVAKAKKETVNDTKTLNTEDKNTTDNNTVEKNSEANNQDTKEKSDKNVDDNKIDKEEKLDKNNSDIESTKGMKKEATDVEEDLSAIKSSLAEQISNELDTEAEELSKLKKKKRLFKIQSSVVITLLCLAGFGFFLGCTKPGNNILMGMGINIGGTVWSGMTQKFDDSTKVTEDVDYLDEEDLKSTAPTVAPEEIVWPDHPGEGYHEDGVYNILLLGEEAIGMGDGRGHTDVMVVATLNTKTKSVKLTSLMRDTLVQIPGYKENKLNSAYAKGGLDLLYETISNNFDIRLDGCVKVNFKNFDKIIDNIGGIELELKQNEADYLNTTNYISQKKYRHVRAGKQMMNGNQVLGYVRVRKTSTITGMNNDYGRTDRHRIVLNAIYEKCRTKSKADLLSMMLKFLPMLTTDIDSNCFEEMLNSYMDLGINAKKIKQLRIPVAGTFKDNLKVRGMSVIIADLDANRKALRKFIFEDGKSKSAAKATVTPTSTKSSGK